MRNKLEARFSQFLLLLGALFLAAYFIAMLSVGDKTNAGKIYKYNVGFVAYIFWFAIFLLVPFSVHRRYWIVIWAILMSATSIAFLVGGFFDIQFSSPWAYFSIAMYTYLAIAPLVWMSESFSERAQYSSYAKNNYAASAISMSGPEVVTKETTHHSPRHHQSHPHTKAHHHKAMMEKKTKTVEHHSVHHKKPVKPKTTVSRKVVKVMTYFRRKPKKLK